MTASADPPQRSPALLARDQWISPTLLNAYAICPHRVRLHYIERVDEPREYRTFLVDGTIAHSLLRHVADRAMRGLPRLEHDELHDMVRRRLHPVAGETRAEHERRTHQLTRWVRIGSTCLDPSAEFLLLEKPRHRSLTASHPHAQLTMTFRPDLVLKRHDEEGPFVEVIDYKTGRRRPDSDLPVISRFVLNAYLAERVANPWDVRMHFTFVWLESGERESISLGPGYCTPRWQSLLGTIDRLLAEQEWPATPSHLCRYCPYNGTVCTAYDPARHARRSAAQPDL